MKDTALALVHEVENLDEKLNLLREYLQAYILRVLHDNNEFKKIVFIGGTSLRFAYNLPRFSEDLDFSLEDKKDYNFGELLQNSKKELKAAGFDVEISFNDSRTVNTALIKFPKLLFDAGISFHEKQKLSIKIEIDTKPPKGGVKKAIVITKYFPLAFVTYDLESLFAGKLNALFTREFTKGRDIFDIFWYLSQPTKITPNLKLLNNSLKQKDLGLKNLNELTWKEHLKEKLNTLDWKAVHKDVMPFLSRKNDSLLISKENLLSLLEEN